MKGLRLGFILCSAPAQPLPSTRIAALNLLAPLNAAGIGTRILYAPPQPLETPPLDQLNAAEIAAASDIVVFQKVRGGAAVALAGALRERGVRTVFMVCDRVDTAMAAATDATIAVTDYLKSLYPPELQARIHVVHDGIEQLEQCKQAWSAGGGGRSAPLRAVLVTSAALTHLPAMPAPPAWLHVRIVGNYPGLAERLRQLRKQWSMQTGGERLRLARFLVNRRISRVRWGLDSVYRELAQADIGVLPITPGAARWGNEHAQAWRLKSENRLTLKMAIGLPVIATPIPAYEQVIEHGVNGYLAQSPQDWAACLAALRDPGRRRAMGDAARAAVATRFSLARQAEAFSAVLATLAGPR